eukprot:m.546869 g.546869  ORF g.546869 m.546869 type:complete len:105 (-) comp57693_c0_seq8:134-448(-)
MGARVVPTAQPAPPLTLNPAPASSWTVEYAKSSRAACRTCGSSIPVNSLRWIETARDYYDSHYTSKYYHHFTCKRPSYFSASGQRLNKNLFTAADWKAITKKFP